MPNHKQPIFKTFGTILKSNPLVDEESNKLETISNILDIPLPRSFDGRKVWNKILSTPITSQKNCGNCWAYATTNMLADRFELQSNGKIRFNTGLSKILPTICEYESDINWQELKDNETAQERARAQGHSTSACNGNSLYNALTYLYRYGTTPDTCINTNQYDEWCSHLKPKPCRALGDYRTDEDLPTCEQLLGIDYDECMDGITAVKRYRATAIYNVPSDERSIMYEIYRFGPVSVGMQVFPDFMSWDGKFPEIYTHPDKRSRSIGGHALNLCGFGTQIQDGKEIDYWLVENSWGEDWGDKGYCKIQRNIPELELEQNVVALIPDIPYMLEEEKCYPEQVKYIESFRSDRLREAFEVDPLNGYRKITIEKIKKGILKGDLKPMIQKKDVPNFCMYVAGHLGEGGKIKNTSEIYSLDSFPLQGVHLSKNQVITILIIVSIIIISLIIYLKKRR